MKFLIALLALFSSSFVFGQKKGFTVHPVSLPPELSWYDNQFSGLCIHEGKLFLMSESRLEDKAEPKLYAISTSDLDHKLKDTSFVLPYKKYHIYNLEGLREKMKAVGDDYEGLEAIVIDGKDVYLSVETATPSNNCYLLKGNLTDTSVVMHPDFLMTMAKPVNADGSHIYNAGFEAVAFQDKIFHPFFEYNYFPAGNYVRKINPASFTADGKYEADEIEKLPFRITDITRTKNDRFTAINYFYKGEGDDTVYRTPANDKNSRLILDSTGYHNYCRLIEVNYNQNNHHPNFTWKTIWEFPKEYSSYNWEGIASYKKGYFIMNDKYTPQRPYASTLLYLKRK
jgi:hypothetical protein